MKNEKFHNFEGNTEYLEFDGSDVENGEFDSFLGKKGRAKKTIRKENNSTSQSMGMMARAKSKKTPEQIEAERLKREMLTSFVKEFMALGHSKFKATVLAKKKYNEWLSSQPQSTINFFGMIDEEEYEDEYNEDIPISAHLDFDGENENEFDSFLGSKAKQKRKSKKTPEELEAIRLKSEMLRAFMKEGLALGYSKRDAKAFAIKKYNEWLSSQPQSTINFFGMIDDEQENEFDEFLGIGAGVAAIKAGKRLKELTNAEEARMAQIEQDLRNSGALPAVAKVKSKAQILLEIQKRKNNEVDKLKKDLIAAKKANWTNAGGRAKRLWEENRQKQLEQESLADSQAVNQNLSQQAQPRLGEIGNVKLPKAPTGLLAKKLASMKFASKGAKDAYIASQTGQTKEVNAGALPESPVTDGVAAPVDESTSTMVTPTVGTNTNEGNEGSEKPNYMLWTGIGLAVLTLGFLAYRKYYAK